MGIFSTSQSTLSSNHPK